MKRVAWLTDLHLEFSPTIREIYTLCDRVVARAPDCVLLGGDTGTAPNLERYLLTLESRLQRPIFFVLGNHDFYDGSIRQVRAVAEGLSRSSRWLRWLTGEGVIELTPHTGLIGHDGWADGRLGNGMASQVLLNDFFLIEELSDLSTRERFARLNALGDEAGDYLQKQLPSAANRFREVILLTHVPPFRETCWHEGRISDDDFLPHFTCKAVGDALLSVMRARPRCNLTVLCGHTHGRGEVTILPNLRVKTGGAEYGQPRLQELIVVE